MSEDVNKAAETSAAVAVAEPMQFDDWDAEGTPIVTEKNQPKKQEAAPAEKPAKEAKSENEAESETAPTQGKKERKPGEKLNRDERISQLTAEKNKLEAELKAERERSREAAPKPPAKETEPEKKVEAPKRPNPFDWTGTKEEFNAAMERWEEYRDAQTLLKFQRAEAEKAQNQKLQSQLAEVEAKYPDAKAKITETMRSFNQTQLPSVIHAMLNDSECLTDVLYVLSDETVRNNFIETAAKNPGKAIRALAQIEADIMAKRSEPAKVEAEPKSEPKSSEEPKPRAPKPPSEVGGRGGAPEDALTTAAKSGDFRSFEAEQNRRKFAKN